MIQHPRIGIRPTIDGRRQGVRESLEVQTMNMAKSVADLISSTLKYPDGEPVECVISPSTIGRVPEAAASHELFKPQLFTPNLKTIQNPCLSLDPGWFL
ncbi:L-fucose isomerase, partial [Streptococcus pneumoniae]|nr:L-fucose isomerase [Streptococcus pneumoniae]